MKKFIILLFVLFAVSYTFSQTTAYKEGLNKPVFYGISNDSNSKSVCDQSNPTNAFEDAYPCNSANSYTVANDLTVNSNEHFVLSQITAELWTDPASTVTSVNITYYEDNSGLPGTEIGSQSGIIPTSQTIIGNNYGYDIHETILDIIPFTFAGQESSSTTYWIGISASTPGIEMYWGLSTVSSNGEPLAFHNVSWSTPDITYDGVYTFSGDCVPICSYFNLTDTYENGYNCGINSQYKTANDLIIEADQKFVLEQIEARIWTSIGNTILSTDITYYDDNGGLPGNEIGSETVVPTSETVIKTGVLGSFDIHRAVFDATPFTFLGQTGGSNTYWIQLAIEDNLGTETYWSVTMHNIVGNDFALKNGENSWYHPVIGMDGIYVFYGQCDIMNTEAEVLTYNLPGQINSDIDEANDSIHVYMPNETDLSALVANFSLSDFATTSVGGTDQISGSTPNDFTSNPTVYTVKAENGTTRDWSVYVDYNVGINTNDAGDLTIYPNPNKGIFSINLSMLNNLPVNIEVLDIQGRTIVEFRNNTSDIQTINLSNYAKSLYYVRIMSEEVNVIKKVSIIK